MATCKQHRSNPHSCFTSDVRLSRTTSRCHTPHHRPHAAIRAAAAAGSAGATTSTAANTNGARPPLQPSHHSAQHSLRPQQDHLQRPPLSAAAPAAPISSSSRHGIVLEIEPRFHGLRDVLEMRGTLKADVGLKMRWGPAAPPATTTPSPATGATGATATPSNKASSQRANGASQPGGSSGTPGGSSSSNLLVTRAAQAAAAPVSGSIQTPANSSTSTAVTLQTHSRGKSGTSTVQTTTAAVPGLGDLSSEARRTLHTDAGATSLSGSVSTSESVVVSESVSVSQSVASDDEHSSSLPSSSHASFSSNGAAAPSSDALLPSSSFGWTQGDVTQFGSSDPMTQNFFARLFQWRRVSTVRTSSRTSTSSDPAASPQPSLQPAQQLESAPQPAEAVAAPLQPEAVAVPVEPEVPYGPPEYRVADALSVTELERSDPRDLSDRGPGWRECAVRFRTESLVRFQPQLLQSFPYDLHKLRVVVTVPTHMAGQDIVQLTACPESDAPPRPPDLGLNDWLVLRQRCYIRTLQPGRKWYMRSNAPPETLSDSADAAEAAATAAAAVASAAGNMMDGSSSGTIASIAGGKNSKGGRRRGKRGADNAATRRKSPAVLQQRAPLEPEFVLEFLLQRRARFWVTTVNLPLLVMELFVPMTFVLPLGDLGMRLSLFVTLLLSPVVFKLAMADRIPPLGCLTTMDIHFIFFYVWMLMCAFMQVIVYQLQTSGMHSAAAAVDAGGLDLSVLLLIGYHAQHYVVHFLPYLKRIRMFEGRSFVCPPVIKVMDTWQRSSVDPGAPGS